MFGIAVRIYIYICVCVSLSLRLSFSWLTEKPNSETGSYPRSLKLQSWRFFPNPIKKKRKRWVSRSQQFEVRVQTGLLSTTSLSNSHHGKYPHSLGYIWVPTVQLESALLLVFAKSPSPLPPPTNQLPSEVKTADLLNQGPLNQSLLSLADRIPYVVLISIDL